MPEVMTPPEKQLFYRMQSDIKDILDAIKGDPLTRTPGFADRLSRIESAQERMAQQVKRLTHIMVGVGVGLIIGGLLFGLVSWDTVLNLLK